MSQLQELLVQRQRACIRTEARTACEMDLSTTKLERLSIGGQAEYATAMEAETKLRKARPQSIEEGR